MSASEMARFKKIVNDTMTGVSFMAMTDNKAVLKVEATEAMKQAAQAATQAARAPLRPKPQGRPQRPLIQRVLPLRYPNIPRNQEAGSLHRRRRRHTDRFGQSCRNAREQIAKTSWRSSTWRAWHC